MTAEQLRSLALSASNDDNLDAEKFIVLLLCEIAAQLAELNTTLRQAVPTPNEYTYVTSPIDEVKNDGQA